MSMTPLEELRHSASHILATAILRLFPDAKLDIGPPTDTRFCCELGRKDGSSLEPSKK